MPQEQLTIERIRDWEARTHEPRLKLALAMTGGTIVSVPNTFGALEPAKDPEQLIDYVPHLRDKIDLDIHPLMNKDSTEIDPDDWGIMAKFVAEQQPHYDGILFSHGTDTIVWSASALRFMLKNGLRIPIVFTGSQLSIVENRTDAVSNIEDSIATLVEARRRRINEIMIVAGRKVYKGVRSIKVSESDFEFIDSPAYPVLGKSTANGIEFSNRADISIVPEPTKEQYAHPLPKIELDNRFMPNVISIDLTPNMSADFLKKMLASFEQQSYQDTAFPWAVILGSFGAGNVPTRLIPAIKEATSKGFTFLLSPQRVGMDTAVVYENARQAVRAGAIQTRDMTREVATIKLMRVLAMWCDSEIQPDGFEKFILTNFYGEVTEEQRR